MQINHCVSSGPSEECRPRLQSSSGSGSCKAIPAGTPSFFPACFISVVPGTPDSSGCCWWSDDAGVDVVPLLPMEQCPSIPPSPTQRSKTSSKLLLASLTRSGGHPCGGHPCGGHHCGGHLPSLWWPSLRWSPPSPATHPTSSSFPAPLCCFPRNHLSGQGGLF